MRANTTGYMNVGVGQTAGNANTTGYENSFLGFYAGWANTSGIQNTFVGSYAGDANTTASQNTAVGNHALGANTTGNYNTAVGAYAADACTTAVNLTAIGKGALSSNTTGSHNTGIGYLALTNLTTGSENTGVGYQAIPAVTTGTHNVAMGYLAGRLITTNSSNVLMGDFAGYDLTGADNVLIGYTAGRASSPSGNLTSESNRICLGNNSVTNSYIKVDWTVTSDERDKADITDFIHGLDYVNELRPVNFVWDDRSNYEDRISDGSKKKSDVQLGFLAQEVAAIETGLGIDNNAIVDTEDENLLKLTSAKLIPVLVNAIKELSTKNEALLARIITLEG
jgi:hypothetical protein